MLLFKNVRCRIIISRASMFIIGIILILLPVLIYNRINHGAFSIVPGHVNNVLGAYHGDSAVADKIHAIKSILLNIPVQIFNFASSYEIPNSLSFYAHRDVIEFLKIFVIPFNLILAFSFVALFFQLQNSKVIFLCLLVATYAASMLLFHIFYRFRIPAVPMLCILAGTGIIQICKLWKKREFLKFFLAGSFVLLFVIFTLRDPDKLRPVTERRTVAFFLIEKGFFRKAEAYIAKMKSDGITTEQLEVYLRKKEIEGEFQ